MEDVSEQEHGRAGTQGEGFVFLGQEKNVDDLLLVWHQICNTADLSLGSSGKHL